MELRQLLQKNLLYYWRINLVVTLGVAVAAAVLTGALMVGDSVRGSLRALVLSQLGEADDVIFASHFFDEALAGRLRSQPGFENLFQAACPLIVLEGLAVDQNSGRRASGIKIYGVDDRFWSLHQRTGKQLGTRDALLNQGLAQELGSGVGDAVLITVELPSETPVETLHGRRDEPGNTMRLSCQEILREDQLGEFSIHPRHGSIRSVFVPLSQLQQNLEQEARVNTILLSRIDSARGSVSDASERVHRLLRQTYSLPDVGLQIRSLERRASLSLEGSGGLLTEALAKVGIEASVASGMTSLPVFSYVVNTLRSQGAEIPYSVVTAIDLPSYLETVRLNDTKGAEVSDEPVSTSPAPPIWLNDWAARDLGSQPGDALSLEYFIWDSQEGLSTQTSTFQVSGIVPLTAATADADLVPNYRGISDTSSVSDWDPPFPIDLSRVRPQDEKYWDDFRATPKAFISLARGQALWRSRFGAYTSLRLLPPPDSDLEQARTEYEKSLKGLLDPWQLGFVHLPVRLQGLEASRGATNFGEYFLYFSFFLVVSALLLTVLFFKLGVEQRLREVGLLRTVGLPLPQIRHLFLAEGTLMATLGSVLGLLGAVAYGWLMMLGLRTWWVEAVGTTRLTLYVTPTSLIVGGLASTLAALLCVVWTLRTLARISPTRLLAGSLEGQEPPRLRQGRILLLSYLCCGLGILLLLSAWLQWMAQVGAFFGAGILLMVALLGFLWVGLLASRRRFIRGQGVRALALLGFRNASYRPSRSILCIALIALATFIIVSVDVFRREGQLSLDRQSGVGGFALLAESSLPLYHNPNTHTGKESLNLSKDEIASLEEVKFSRLRLRPGDDASCLNLYRPRNPRILGTPLDFVKQGRFSFQSSLAETAEERENPWLLLGSETSEGAVPAIADATSMAYVLHLGLGDEIVLDSSGQGPIRLKLVAALSDSVLQGELLISEQNFLRLFPDQEGYRFFLLDLPETRVAEVSRVLEDGLSDYGFDVVGSRDRLASFHRVENTYLSTFQTLGGLGLLLGTLGLGAILLRNVLERKKELALMRTVGYRSSHLAVSVLAENLLLLCCGLGVGAGCALVAVAPAMLIRPGSFAPASTALLLLLVLAAGLISSLGAVAAAVRSPLIPALRAE